VNIPLQVEATTSPADAVHYRWDEDTDILTAEIGERVEGGRSVSVDVEGSDGSWLIFDVRDGAIRGVEVAVWPTVRKRSGLAPPATVETVSARIGSPGDTARVSALEVDMPVSAESDRAERTLHFRLGTTRQSRTVRVAQGLLLDLDDRDRLVGVWLLDVPPLPGNS
jgi:hypothetical protein